MKVEHIAIWAQELERLTAFYETYFGAHAGPRYVNPAKQFESCSMVFDSGARLELMSMPTVREAADVQSIQHTGYAHIAFSVGSEEAVDDLTRRLGDDGYTVLDGPRRTGDGYYESCVLDPDGNRLEITA